MAASSSHPYPSTERPSPMLAVEDIVQAFAAHLNSTAVLRLTACCREVRLRLEVSTAFGSLAAPAYTTPASSTA